ncbi:MAG: alpha/beta fold hydrolase [Fibrobacteria bacterium]
MTPRTSAQNQALRTSSRTRILDGALKTFSRLGFESASVRAIAAEAGVAQGLLYSHFSGKEELLKAIFSKSMDDVRESFGSSDDNAGQPPLERLIRSAFAILRRNLGFWRLTYGIRMQETVLQTLGPELQAWTGDILKTLEAHFRSIGSGQPAMEAAILFAAIDGISQHYALDPERYPLDAIADALIEKYATGKTARMKKPSEKKPLKRNPERKLPMTTLIPAPPQVAQNGNADIDRKGYPFLSRYVTLPAGRMHYVDEGPGPGPDALGPEGLAAGRETLLFVHGTPTWSYDWRRLISAFSGNHRCIAPDHLGFGLSDRPEVFDYSPESHSRNLEAFVQALDLRDVTLIVHDFGGPIALPLALKESSLVKRVVLLNTWMWSFAGDKPMEKAARIAGGTLGRFLYRRFNFSLRVLAPYAYGDRKKLTPSLHRQYLDRFPDADSRGRVLWALARSLLASSAFYASQWERRGALLNLPVLILWGMKDRAFPPHLLARWREALPEAKVTEFPDAGHWPQVEAPVAVEKEIRAFLTADMR